MDCRAHVVPKSRQRQLRSARSAADRLLPLDDKNGSSCLGERDRSSQAVRPGADDNRV
jgi:hypothetical protein